MIDLRPIFDQIAKLRDRVNGTPTVKIATVTQASPLRIQLDGDTEPLPFTPIGASGWTVGDKLICVKQRLRVYILAPAS